MTPLAERHQLFKMTPLAEREWVVEATWVRNCNHDASVNNLWPHVTPISCLYLSDGPLICRIRRDCCRISTTFAAVAVANANLNSRRMVPVHRSRKSKCIWSETLWRDNRLHAIFTGSFAVGMLVGILQSLHSCSIGGLSSALVPEVGDWWMIGAWSVITRADYMAHKCSTIIAIASTGVCTGYSGLISSHLFVPRNKYYSTYRNSVPK